jgi:hypothetical protein
MHREFPQNFYFGLWEQGAKKPSKPVYPRLPSGWQVRDEKQRRFNRSAAEEAAYCPSL